MNFIEASLMKRATPETQYGATELVHCFLMYSGKDGVNGAHDFQKLLSSEHVVLFFFVHEVSLSGQSHQPADESVHKVLHVREVNFHRCLDGDRLLHREARVEGCCCEPFTIASEYEPSVMCVSLCILAYFEPEAVEAKVFMFRRMQWDSPRGTPFSSHGLASKSRCVLLAFDMAQPGSEDTARQADSEQLRLTLKTIASKTSNIPAMCSVVRTYRNGNKCVQFECLSQPIQVNEVGARNVSRTW